MGFLDPLAPPYDPDEWSRKPFAERSRLACQAWAVQGDGTPLPVYAVYALKVAAYVGGWIFFCGDLRAIGSWGLTATAFEKAVLWSMLFEGLGLGCGSGPLTGRYSPPLGGFLYFLRPGTTKLPVLRGLPLLGGTKRTWLDVALYLALLVALVRALVSPAAGAIPPSLLWPVVVLVPLCGMADRTIFLALRAEHYWTTAVCFLWAGNWI